MERRSKSYLKLLKPGITFSNTLMGVAGIFLAASTVPFEWTALLGALLGIGGVIAAACVVNNVLDRDIDKRMKRTAKRDVASGIISVNKALTFAVILAVIGFGSLMLWTNAVTLILGVIAFVWYVVIYGYAKRTTAYSTLIGGVAGALPPAAGYTALTGSIDAAAIILFLILFFWQMPHFYAIAMFRRSDYAAAGLPVWSVKYGMKSVKWQILAYTVLFALSASSLTFFGYTGVIYLFVSLGLATYWITRGATLYNKVDDEKWARHMFGVSLLVLLAMIGLIAAGGFLP
jgi:protoheme IX farnesyltransferase